MARISAALAAAILLMWLSVLVCPAIAGETVRWMEQTFATIRETDAPNAVAEILFHNEYVNGPQDDGETILTLGDLTVEITFKWDVQISGADRITVTVPDGYFAEPESLTVEENQEGLLLIYPLEAMGV